VKALRSTVASVVCASLLLPLAQTYAVAAPLPKPSINNDNSGVTLVHRRGGRGAGAAILGGIIAGALIAGAVREGRAEERDIRRCEREFRSFDRRTGTYINRYGDERVCPYLR